MVSHQEFGQDFRGAVRYLYAGRKDQPVDKQVEILAARGVRTGSPNEMSADFEMGRLANTRLEVAVWHVSLSFNPADADRLNNGLMLDVAEGYLQKMGLDKTQYVIARHHDVPGHQHLHIVANRVDDAGKSIADGRCFPRSRDAMRELIVAHGLTMPQGMRAERQHPERLQGNEWSRYELKRELRQALVGPTELPAVEEVLRAQQIEVRYYRNKAGEATGISFAQDGVAFKGSALGPEFSLPGIQKQLAANAHRQQAAPGAAENPIPEMGPALAGAAAPAISVLDPLPVTRGDEQLAALPTPERSAAEVQADGPLDPMLLIVAPPAAVDVPTPDEPLPAGGLPWREWLREQEQLARWEAEQEAEAEQDRLADAYEAWLELGEQVQQQVVAATQEALTSGTAFADLLAKQGLDVLSATSEEPLQVQHRASGERFTSEDILLPVLLLTPDVQKTAQYGLIEMGNSAERPATVRLAEVRERLLEAGLTIGPVNPAADGSSAELVYAFNPQQVDLELVAALLEKVQYSTRTVVVEAPHALGAFSRHGHGHAIPIAQWPEREGQFNKARVEIDNTDQRAPGRAARIRHELSQQGVVLGPVETDEQGYLTFELRYHTLSPAIADTESTLARAQDSTGISVHETTQQQQARYSGITLVAERSKGYERSI